MKKVITMILTLAVAITAIAVPSNKANAETTPANITYTPMPTQTPKPPEHEDICVIRGNKFFGSKICKDGETAPVTKGFKLNLRLSRNYDGPVLWSSSSPDIAPISADGTVTGKKYGKTTITAEYGGTTSYIIVNVVKNEYSVELKEIMWDFHDGKGKSIGKYCNDITSIKFDKKGNLKCVFTAMDKLNKRGMKQAKKYGDIKGKYNPKSPLCERHAGGRVLVIENSQGKVILKATVKNDGGIFSWKPGLNKPNYVKFTVKKKYLKVKQKDVDLGTCKVTF